MMDGNELLAEAAKEPTLDEYLKRDPATLEPKDIRAIIAKERERRAVFIAAESARKAKRKGEEESKSNEEEVSDA